MVLPVLLPAAAAMTTAAATLVWSVVYFLFRPRIPMSDSTQSLCTEESQDHETAPERPPLELPPPPQHEETLSTTPKSYPVSTQYITCDAPSCTRTHPNIAKHGFYYCSMECYHQTEPTLSTQLQRQAMVAIANYQDSILSSLEQQEAEEEDDGATLPPTPQHIRTHPSCAICLETFVPDRTHVVVLNCRHVFCFSCLMDYQQPPLARPRPERQVWTSFEEGAGLPTDEEMTDWLEGQVRHESRRGNQEEEEPLEGSSPMEAVGLTCPCCRTPIPNVRSLTIARISKRLSQMERLQHYSTPSYRTTHEYQTRMNTLWNRVSQQLDLLHPFTGQEDTLELQCHRLKCRGLFYQAGANPQECLKEYKALRWRIQQLYERKRNIQDMYESWKMQPSSTLSEQTRQFQFYKELQRQLKKGIPSIEKVDLVDVTLEYIEVRMACGEWAMAVSDLKQLLEESEDAILSPQHWRKVFMGFSRCFYELKQYQKSIEAGQVCVKMNRFFPGVYTYIGKSYQAMEDFENTDKAFSKAVLYEAPWDKMHRAKTQEQYDLFRSQMTFGKEGKLMEENKKCQS